MKPLSDEFYARPVLTVARQLIGKLLVREWDGRRVAGRIVETEAYGGREDPASHSYRGPTPRCQTMFGPVGRAYVYFSYGTHYCFNVVAGSRKRAEAVLIRAVEPALGVAWLREARIERAKPGRTRERIASGVADHELANGPGKLAAAFRVGPELDGHSLLEGEVLWIAEGESTTPVEWTPRIGLGQNPAAEWFWRCVERGSRFTTRTPRSMPTRARPSRD